MSEYQCIQCGFITKRKNNYIRHIHSKKHTKKSTESGIVCQTFADNLPDVCRAIAKTFKCELCDKKLSCASSLSKHKHRCKIKKEIADKMQMDYERKLFEVEKNNFLEKEKQYQEDIAYYKHVIEMTGHLAKKSARSLGHLIKHHPTTQPLKRIGRQSLKQLQYQGDNKNQTNDDFIKTIVRHHRNKTISKFIGDFIVSIYKKENIKDQAIWATDTSRLTYVIRELLNKESKWMVDKKGVKTQNKIIDPLLLYLQEHLNKYTDTMVITRKQYDTRDDYYKAAEFFGDIIIIAKDLTNGPTAKAILKYIAPRMFMDSE